VPSARQWLLRHLARRFRIGEDILGHLTTFQRLGEHFEIDAPQEMLPVGARTVARALRSRAAPQIRPDWLWPYWLERQLDPRDEAFVPRGHLAVMTNLTHRNWTSIGNLWSPWEAIVDPTGLVTPWFDGWSLDWWVEQDGTWRFPSRDDAVSQSLYDGDRPIVQTRLASQDGGEVIQRAYAQVGTGLPPGAAELATVEIENRSGAPVRVAFALRPYNPEGLAVLSDIAVRGTQVTVNDNMLALLLPSTPQATELSTFKLADTANTVAHGVPRGARDASIHDPAGLATAAFVYDLDVGAVIRAAMPLMPGIEQRKQRGIVERFQRWPEVHAELRSAGDIARAWEAPLDRGMRVELPDERLQHAVDANRAFMLLLHDPGSITPGPFTYHRFWFRDAAYQTVALDRWGLHAEADDVLRTFPDRQRADGYYYSQWREWDANGAAIWALAEHHRLTGDDRLLAATAPSVARGARWIARKRRERGRDAPELRGLLPPGVSAEHLGPFDYYYWDDFWSLRGLQDAAYVGYLTGDLGGAADAERTYRSLLADVQASIERTGQRLGIRAIPAGPTRGVDPGMIGSLAACEPLRVLAVDDPWIQGTADVIRDRFCLGDAFFQGISHTGLGTYLTLQLAFVELEAGDARAWDRLMWLLDSAMPTFTWPEAIHPQLGGGCMGDGHHGWAAADLLSFVRNLLVREGRDGSVLLLGLLPDAWFGERVVVRDAPTHRGLVSYTLDWDDDRPVLSWECAEPGVTLRVPGLDPGWVTTEQRGQVTFSALGS
jgi:hypothetical protein